MIHEYFKDFVDKFNIRNGELASQKKLNESVNVLKKEADDLYNRSELIRGKNAFAWQQQTLYRSGEIAEYEGVNYIVIDGQESINEVPSQSYKWIITTRSDWTMELDPNGYIHRENTDSYMPIAPGNPAVKRYVDNGDKQFYRNLNLNDGINFMPLDITALTDIDHITAYLPTEDYHPANKKYVDLQIDDLRTGGSITVGNTLNSEGLGNRPAESFVTLYREFNGNYNGFAVKNGENAESINSTDWMRITSNGLLPYDTNSTSSLGNDAWKFKEVHSLLFNGTVAQKYSTDNPYEIGTILSAGSDVINTYISEAALFNEGGKMLGIIVKTESNNAYIVSSGRVWVKLKTGERAYRGDYLIGTNDGVAKISSTKTDDYLGICITGGTDLVEVKI